MKHTNSADMRRAAIRTMDFDDEARKLATEIRALKKGKIEALLKKAAGALQTYGMKAKGTIYDADPRRGFFEVQMDVEVLGDPLGRDEFQDTIDQVLGYGWHISTGGPGWSIQFEYPSR